MTKVHPGLSDYDNFVTFCMEEFRRHRDDPGLRYFDNRFYNRVYSNQTGHLRQAFYSAREFFRRYPQAREVDGPIVESGRLVTRTWSHLDQWRRFVRQHRTVHLPEGGDMETVWRILPTSLGGLVHGGGGAGPSFKVVIPLVAKYLGAVRERASFLPIGADRWAEERDEPIPARRARFFTTRIIRDSDKSRNLKDLYRDYCQVCHRRIEIRRGGFYSEAHHLRPLGGRHQGPDTKPNMLVLCPWHHAEFDHFLYLISPRSFELDHRLRPLQGSERRLQFVAGHHVGSDFVDYNNDFFKKLSRG